VTTVVLSAPRIIGTVHLRFNDNDYPDIEDETLQIDIQLSEEEMNRLTELMGNGGAEISLGDSMGEKDFGNGYEAFVNVKLTVDQSEDGIDSGAAELFDLMDELLPEAADRAHAMYKKKLEEHPLFPNRKNR
jgi:hypothetical protein